jgi:NADPH-dependent curcumin reductase CurA
MQAIELQVRRDALAEIAPVPREIAIGDDEVLLKVDRFALTANNVTYAAHGVDMRYWDFFPAAPDHGIVPVWGFASVVDSRAAGIAPGDRFYGYWPMASHALLRPGKVNPRGFTDVAAHRQKLPPVYNGYVAASPAYGSEAVQALFRPLYTTSFVLDQMFRDSPSQTLVLTSASSKTALGLAQAVKGRQRIVGLTSKANIGFVESTGYFDAVVDYADVATLAGGDDRVALVDFSGNGTVRHAVHSVLGDRLIESHVVGDTHWDVGNTNKLPGVVRSDERRVG